MKHTRKPTRKRRARTVERPANPHNPYSIWHDVQQRSPRNDYRRHALATRVEGGVVVWPPKRVES